MESINIPEQEMENGWKSGWDGMGLNERWSFYN
jgi:hypothetical protein